MKSIMIAMAVTAMTACAGGTHANESAGREASAAALAAMPDSTVRELPLPDVPGTLTAPADRAAYIVEHFWDAMDFTDTLLTRDEAFMEQNFANYQSLFPYVERPVLATSVRELMARAEADREAYNRLADIADKYLYDPNSPMLNEEYYILFLDAITGSGFMDKTRRSRFEYQLQDASKNRPGTIATDFAFIDRGGKRSTLHATADGHSYRLVLFYDPDCDHCEETIGQLKSSAVLNRAVQSGLIKVLAVYSDGDTVVWERSKGILPASWTDSYSPEGAIEGEELYVLRAMPTMYLIAPDNTVALKDPSVPLMLKMIENIK